MFNLIMLMTLVEPLVDPLVNPLGNHLDSQAASPDSALYFAVPPPCVNCPASADDSEPGRPGLSETTLRFTDPAGYARRSNPQSPAGETYGGDDHQAQDFLMARRLRWYAEHELMQRSGTQLPPAGSAPALF